MTKNELHKILGDENKKLSKKELAQVIYELKNDTLEAANESKDNKEQKFYFGESNALQICLDLLEHLEE